MEIKDLKPSPRNPRVVDDAALAGLKRSVETFGDISGLVFNRTTKRLVAGHQRLRALQEEFGNGLKFEDHGDSAAIVTPKGDEFWVRFVDWDEHREEAANLTANNPSLCGAFDNDALRTMLAELQSTDWGEVFQELRLDELSPRSNALNELADHDHPIGESYQVVVECNSENEQRQLFERLTKEGFTCRALML